MKILHTSDWHLGAYLEDMSRLEEQQMFIDELFCIVEENEIDLILVAGDIFDTSNPPSAAQKLFYSCIKKLSNNKRPIVFIAGNHDSPERLNAPNSVLYENGAIVLDLPSSVAILGDYGFYKIINASEGCFEIEIREEKAVIITMPFPNEKRLNAVLSMNNTEEETQAKFTDKIKTLTEKLEKNYRSDTINLFIGHFHIVGGTSSGSERDIIYGGSLAVNSDALPKSADYIAMGHLHKPQQIAKMTNGMYCGSPIKYSLSEIDYTKLVYIIDKEIGNGIAQDITIKPVYLTDYKPIEAWVANSIEEAISLCEIGSKKNCYVYLNIYSKRPLLNSELKLLYSLKKDLKVIFNNSNEIINKTTDKYIQKSVVEEFIDFYVEQNNSAPNDELIETFLEIINNID